MVDLSIYLLHGIPYKFSSERTVLVKDVDKSIVGIPDRYRDSKKSSKTVSNVWKQNGNSPQ